MLEHAIKCAITKHVRLFARADGQVSHLEILESRNMSRERSETLFARAAHSASNKSATSRSIRIFSSCFSRGLANFSKPRAANASASWANANSSPCLIHFGDGRK